MKILAFATSMHEASENKRLMAKAAELARAAGAEVEEVDLRDLGVPIFDHDVWENDGVPESVQELGAKIAEAAGTMVAAPEYNHGLAGPTKNVFDWVSRLEPNPVGGKLFLLMSASPASAGGWRALTDLRTTLCCMAAWAHPDLFNLGRTYAAWNDDGTLADEKVAARLDNTVADFVSAAGALANRHGT